MYFPGTTSRDDPSRDLLCTTIHSINNNSYLQSKFEEINPRLINRCVHKAREFQWQDVYDLEPPFNRLTSDQPTIPAPNVDVTRRPVAFGRWAMPKLRRELHHEKEEVVIAAIESIADLCHDPERGYEAVHLKVVDRMVDRIVHENPIIQERSLMALEIIARLADGKEAIVSNDGLLDNLVVCVEDQLAEVRIKAAALLEMIARFWKTADVLIRFGFIQVLLGNLLEEENEIVDIHLETLKSMMYGAGKKIALDADAFNIFMDILDERTETGIVSKTLDCLTRLTFTRTGEKMAQEINLLETLNRYLHDEVSNTPSHLVSAMWRSMRVHAVWVATARVYTSAASTIMYCTIKTKAKITASKIKGLAKRLIDLAQNHLNPTIQMYAIKVRLLCI
ncbi:hypothetical protein NQ317_001417 [Molorchus minor]|uniref:Rhabdoid tumor deletion region protein 1 n=1 Tax=Molorchus minor TaxID=1323400 RepID=A0ABQ9JYN2_9CUCU|nr:hypothetical protein NQ317_001417 [Molorchus minor]